MVPVLLRDVLWSEEMLAFLFPGLNKGSSSFKTFLGSKHGYSEALGAAIPLATAALPVKREPSSVVYLVPIASQMYKNK